MRIALQILNIVLCIFMAKLDSKTISLGRRPNHWLNALIHLTIASFGLIVFGWAIGVAILFESNIAFNVALNLFRNKSVDYVSSRPASLVDQLEKKIFGKNGLLPKVIYLALSIILNFL